MASNPRPPGSYLWNTARDIGRAASNEASKAASDIGNTYQAFLYSGWSTQAAHNSSQRTAGEAAIAQQMAVEEDAKRIEPEPEIAKDGPEKE